jgi:UDP-glucose 4-epimerase
LRLTFDRVLVTGGAGFIGSHTVDALVETGTEVWVLDNLYTGSTSNLKTKMRMSELKFRKGDVRDNKLVDALVRKVDATIHLAAVVSPYLSIKRPDLVNDVNVVGTLNVLRSASANHIGKVIFASSSSVYGLSKKAKVSENAPLEPITPYGASKVAAENYCRIFYSTFDLNTVRLRYLNVYGPRQRSNPYSGVISIFTHTLMAGRRPIIYGDGKQTRDFVHVSDVVDANLLALKTGRGVGEAFNIGTGRATSIRQLYEAIADLTEKKLSPIFRSKRPGDIMHSCGLIKKAQTVLNYRPTVALKDGLRSLIEYVRTSDR